MALNLNSVRAFAAVAEHRGFSRAARALHVSQPAVSRAVRALERRVGTALIERAPRGLRLTEAGEVLWEHARGIFALERSAEEALAARAGLERGRLRVGASTTVATYVLPPLLAAFGRRHPGVEVTVASGNTERVARRLLAYELEVAVVEGPVEDARLEAVPWREDELVPVAGASHPLAGRERLEPSELAGEVFLGREAGSGTREVAEAALSSAGLAGARRMEIGSPEAIKQAVAAGLGVALVSRAAIGDQLALGTLRVLPVPALRAPRTFDLLRVRGRRASPATAAFEGMLAPELDGRG